MAEMIGGLVGWLVADKVTRALTAWAERVQAEQEERD